MEIIVASDFNPITVGWREWLCLPELGIQRIKAKVDTGARTSALHAFKIDHYNENGLAKVRFNIHPLQNNNDVAVTCIADVIDVRWVTDSGGHKEQRFVVQTLLTVGKDSWPIEVTLTNREDMRFRMLLGRTAMRKRIIVNPGVSFLLGKF